MGAAANAWRDSLSANYDRLRPTLLRVLARLSRQGFPAPVSDGLDYVHDFLLAEWPAILRTFDPQAGSLERYAAVAFERFARRHIVRQRRRYERLLDAQTAASRIADTRVDARPSPEELGRLGEALAMLGPADRELLDDYFGRPGRSERSLARSRGVTRHQLRDDLLQALASVAVALGDRGLIAPGDWLVAREIWEQGWTTHEVANRLGLSVREVVQARNRVLGLFAKGLGRGERRPSSEGKMMAESRRSTPESLVARLLDAPVPGLPGDLLEDVRAQAAAFRQFLDEHEDAAERLGEHLDAFGADAIATFYDALAGDSLDAQAPEYDDLSQALDEAGRSSDEWIGRACAEALMVELPGRLDDIERHFARAPRVPFAVAKSLLEEPSSRAAGPNAGPWLPAMAARGLTPASIFQATEAVPGLLRRLKRREKLGDGDVMLMETGVFQPWSGANAQAMVFESICHATDCEAATAPHLVKWLVAVAQARPYLFAGLQATPDGERAVRLSAHPETATRVIDRSLITRWSVQGRPARIDQGAPRDSPAPERLLVARDSLAHGQTRYLNG